MTARPFFREKFLDRLYHHIILSALILAILAAGALLLAWPRPALAWPDPGHYISQNEILFVKDQSLGIWSTRDFDFPPLSDFTVEVKYLTKDITPVADPSYISVPFPAGIYMFYEGQGVNDDGDGFPGCNLTLNYHGGSHSIQTQAAEAAGIYILSRGHDGNDGGTGGAGGSVSVTSSGAIETTGVDAVGLLAQSTGGNGGDGHAGGSLFDAGGPGGQGGNGASVTVTSSSDITTQGNGACGLYLQSSGGNGGKGGNCGALLADSAGYGGNGGHGGQVILTNNGAIQTAGEQAHGIYAVSLGGAGGDGGTSGDVLAGMGGNAGDGGDSGNVTIYCNQGSINTTGKSAHGIYVLSQAGSGGHGGNGGAALVGTGGSGGAGGTAGNVLISNQTQQDITITTSGDQAYGIVAQSLGGAGGDGGTGAGIVGSGGATKGSGPGGEVEIDWYGTIATQGEGSRGIFAQSVGGFAGSGGASGGLAAFGASGQSGGSGGQVSVTLNNGAVTTQGDWADAIFAQSVGGGGGSGGSSGGLFSFGGTGDAGGNGGNVTVNNNAQLQTAGDFANGIFAQSVGGGGGEGGSTGSGGLMLDISMGGQGGSGGDGGQVTISNYGDINTQGFFSAGIFAQSAGGGGGAGGYAVSASVGVDFDLAVALGGSGGDGGDGGTVEVTNSGNITTQGDASAGISAASIGGGGGCGGFSIAASASSYIGSAMSLGGSGGDGGDGGQVTIKNTGDITTSGFDSAGIVAQSSGGGGGSGGFSIAGALASDTPFSCTIGGSGGIGGHGGEVGVANTGAIVTAGDISYGIMAASIGGGGGAGGFSIAAAGGNFPLSESLGGSGGHGGDGGKVGVVNTGDITTFGVFSCGILAQSVGGGGGNGGFTLAGSLGQVTSNLSMGGSGGDGGHGAAVEVVNYGNILTYGEVACGILAQSVGGGGGNGGISFEGELGVGLGISSNTSLSVGGSGGQGGNGSTVQVTTSGVISTGGNDAHGILAQSIGGGGGNGSFSGSADIGISGEKTYSYSLAVDVGGSGGTAGVGGSVTVNSQADITTLGENSYGILAQSVGGGGGNAGGTFSVLLTAQLKESKFGWNLAASIGGHGGDGNHGGTVEVTNQGNINTSGANSHGILTQSVGGGGGAGGNAHSLSLIFSKLSIKPSSSSLTASVGGNGGGASDGGQVTVNNNGAITTQGNYSDGIFAQSIGGGGGTGGNSSDGLSIPTSLIPSSVELALGGSGGSSGNGGDVSVTNSGAITTSGEGSFGIMAQSAGGGGGVAGNGAIGFLLGIGIGGAGGAGGQGGEVTVTNSGSINTSGDGAMGIMAQSVGGGGGLAGNVSRFLSKSADVGIGLGWARDGGAGGDGGNVTVTSTGDITTQGASAHGIFAQSVGGGGGLAGNVGSGPTETCLAGSVGGAGSGGKVSVSQTGDITTQGEEATGIWAQSAGGQGSGGAVHIALAGNILCSGANANGIQAQSLGLAGNGDITITINSGTVQGGSGGTGVVFMDGATNKLTNYGTITTLDGIAGMAIQSIISSSGMGIHGNETINNYGVVTGSVDLCAGINAFNNQEGATFNAGAIVHLGTGNLFTNAGTFNPYGSGSTDTVGTVNLTGNFRQTTNGIHAVELASATSYDQVAVTGTANLRGKLTTSLLNDFLPQANQVFTGILTAGTGISGTYDKVHNFSPTLLANVIYHANSVDLQAVRDYTNPGLGLAPHQRGVGAMLNSVADTASGDLNEVLRAIDRLPNAGQVAGALDQISHEKASAMSILAFAGANLQARNLSQRITDLRFGKWQPGGQDGWPGSFGLNYSRVEGLMLAYNSSDLSSLLTAKRKAAPETKWGLYLTPALVLGSQKSSAPQTGFNFNIAGFTAGADYRVRDDLLIGVASGYSHTGASFRGSGGDLETHTWPLSVYGAYLPESFYAFGSLGYALNLFNQDRNISFPGVSRQPSGSTAGHQFNLYTEAGYDLKVKPFVVTPVASLSYSRLWIDGFTENGAGSLDMQVSPQNAESLQTGVGAKIAVPLHRGPTVVVPQVYATYQHEFADNSRGLDARLSQGSSTYTFQTAEPQRDFAVLGANVTIMAKKNFTIQLNYNAEVGRSNYTAHYMSAGLRWEF